MQRLLLLVTFFFLCISLFAQKDARLAKGLLPITEVPTVQMPLQDNTQLLAEEEARSGPGVAPRFATNISVDIDPATDGLWEYTADGAVWRLRIHSSKAKSLNLGFTTYFMPKDGQLLLYSPDYREVRGPFTPADNEEHEQLWTPILEGEELVIEVQLPLQSVDQLQLKLAYVNHAFKSFSALISGSCNLDVICGAADGWGIVDAHRDIIQSVAVISTGGGTFCTGFLVNNVQQDCTPFFMTANHCGINSGNAASLVTYWNYQNSICRQPGSGASGSGGDGVLNDFNTGANFRASRSASDFTLVELDDPISPTANAYFAGWDATGNDINSAIGIHHPRTDEKRISFENDATQFTTYSSNTPTNNYTHVRVIDWDVGTTEGGSSGSPLFDQNERVVGQLHGGGAACGNNSSDWYGSFAVSWDAGGGSSSRLRDWLDPASTGTRVIDGRWANDCSFTLVATPVSLTVCQPQAATYSIQVSSAFPSNVSFSLSGNPSGGSFSFSPSSVPPGGTTTLTMQTTNINPGTYSFTVTGSASGNSGDITLGLTVLAGSQDSPTLLDPANNSTGVFPNPVLSWEGDDSGATSYEVQISTNSSFTNIIETGNVTSTSYQPTSANMGLTRYYWRVRSINDCGTSNFSSGWSFVTQNVACVTYVSDFSTTISEVGSPSISNDIFIPDDFTIAEVSVSVDVTHTYVGDLDARLLPASGGSILLFDRPGFPSFDFGCNQDNMLVSFSANSPNTATDLENTCNTSDTGPNNPGPPHAISGSYRPIGNLNSLNNQSSDGLWTLEINDNEAADGGILEEWSITVCYEVPSSPPQLIVNEILPVPHNDIRTVTNAYLAAEDGESTASEITFTLNTIPTEGSLRRNGQLLNVNGTFTQADIDNNLITYEHNGGSILNDDFNFDVTNAAGLSVNDNTFLIEIIVEPLEATRSQTGFVLCNGGNEGEITVTAMGGVPPYNYALNGGTGQASNVFGNLTAGVYTVSVTDDLGTSVSTSSITITQPITLSATAMVADDQITVTPQGGTPGYTYRLNGGSPQGSNVFSNLANGTYSIQVTDSNGCTTTVSATVAVNTLALNATLTEDIDCFNDNDAVITITASGGTPPLQYRLNGGPLQDSPIFNNLAAGTYTPEVIDSEGFSRQTTAITIDNPAELTAGLTINMNTITVSASGGTPPLQYQLDNTLPQNSNVFNNVANGTYTIRVIDSNGCTVSLSATVAVNTLALNATLTEDIDCFNDNDAIITITASGGTPPLQYRLNGGPLQDSPVFNNLAAGTYTPEVVDSEGFSRQTTAITIDNPAELTAGLTVNMNTITVSASGGIPPLQYQLDNTPPQNSNVFSNVANGSYTVRVIDTNGCTVSLSATVAVNTLALNATLTESLDCFNDNDAVITITATGGTPPLQYRLNGGPLQDSPVFNNLSAGTYTPEVVDSEGFSRQTTAITIDNPAELTAGLTVNMNTITVSAVGGTLPLQYQLNNNPPQNSNVFSDVANGVYIVLVIDANNCTVGLSTTVAVNTLLLSATVTEALDCFNDNDAVITLTATGGTPPLQYRLNGGTLQDSPIFDNLSAGTYIPEVVDSEGFIRQITAVTIGNPDELTASSSVFMSSIVISAMGGTPPLQYQLGNNTPQNENVFTSVANGSYTVRVIDANGCTIELAATVAVNTLLLSATLTEPLDCFNDNDAVITLTATGGTPPLQYRLNGGPLQDSPVFNNLAAGTYTPEVVDSEGFSRQISDVDVANPAELEGGLMVDMNTITVSAMGGTPPLQYQLNDNLPQDSNVFSGLTNGAYTIQVIDANGCSISLPATVLINNMMVTTTVITVMTCTDVENAMIGANVSDGTPPFLFSLNGGPFQESSTFGGLGVGTYTIEVEDANGFTETSNTVSIENPELLLIDPMVDGSNLTIVASGGTGDLEYSIDGEQWFSNPVFLDLPDGIYQVSVRDENGCATTIEVIIAVNSIVASVQIVDEVSCNGAQDASLMIVVEGGIIPYLFSLDGTVFQGSNVFADLEAGEYNIVVEDQVGAVFNMTYTIIDPPVLSLEIAVNDNLITAMADGGTAPYTYQLNGGDPQEDPAFPGLANGEYELMVTDAHGCTATQMASVLVGLFDIQAQDLAMQVYPNPNQGQFQVQFTSAIEHSLQFYVYNTAGQLVSQRTIGSVTANYLIEFDLRDYPSGVYQIVATDGDKFGVLRVIVER